MQNTKMNSGEYVLFSVPVEMLEEAGIGEESVVQMSAGNGKIIINTVKDTEDFAGTFFVVGEDGENFRSLTDSETVKYMERFAEPEDISQDEVESDMGITFYSM